MHVLVTGGAGYIGSHTVLALLEAGHSVHVVDNLSNASAESLRRVEKLTGKMVPLDVVDLLDRARLHDVVAGGGFDAVVHFAALKAVGESVREPLRYYRNNITGTINLCEEMALAGVKAIVFSSSATVYDPSNPMPLQEGAKLGAVNPYGRTKLMMEMMLQDLQVSDPDWRVWLLRYFNPIGAHESGLIGEDPAGEPNNLVPYIAQVATGRRKELRVFGDDYPTPDGTGVRDYIHVVDLAIGHVKALERMAVEAGGVQICNLGTGQGYSVLDVIKAFETASGVTVPYAMHPRRPGDAAVCYADPAYAEKILGWRATRDLAAMCADTWRWQSANPFGYAESETKGGASSQGPVG
ncbi:MAG: UDP-glucose 4-epimerase GalE [Kiritimatiellia bacterium]